MAGDDLGAVDPNPALKRRIGDRLDLPAIEDEIEEVRAEPGDQPDVLILTPETAEPGSELVHHPAGSPDFHRLGHQGLFIDVEADLRWKQIEFVPLDHDRHGQRTKPGLEIHDRLEGSFLTQPAQLDVGYGHGAEDLAAVGGAVHCIDHRGPHHEGDGQCGDEDRYAKASGHRGIRERLRIVPARPVSRTYHRHYDAAATR